MEFKADIVGVLRQMAAELSADSRLLQLAPDCELQMAGMDLLRIMTLVAHAEQSYALQFEDGESLFTPPVTLAEIADRILQKTGVTSSYRMAEASCESRS
ncbi:hypothetical protein [Paenibacillus methanolicus]|uniref:hypothetical protein n=1 Tax=Paenibacillus methanolicus TaxID=582686 RepID=UPI0011E8636D|nr:hypothetical protein [Paenibacillus methanolicus]